MLRRLFGTSASHFVIVAMAVLGSAGLLRAQDSTGPFYFAYDEAGRLVGVVDAAGNTARYTYDALGNILSIGRGSSAVSILEFSPNSGAVGAKVTIVGAGFSATAVRNVVTFNGVSATVVSATPNQLTAVVPRGATTGPIRVTSPAGSAVSATPFTVGPNGAPSISGFTPRVGTAGSTVAITGTGFEPAVGNDKVAFNGRVGAVSSAAAATLGVVVPTSATSGHITVSTPNGRATSAADFFVPPSPYTAADVEVTGRMAVGDGLAMTITSPGKIGLIVFDGTAGQRISLSAGLGTGLAGGGCDAMSIRRPDGALLGSTSSCGSSGFVDRQVLPVSGTYLITFDPAGTETGTAMLTLHIVPPDVTAGIAAGGSPVTVTTTTPGQNAAVSFAGSPGQRVSLKVSFGSGLTADCNYLSIQNPDGTPFLSQTLTCSPSYFSDVLVLPAAGTYTITVNPGAGGVGSTTLTLYSVPPDATAEMAVGGSPVTVTTTTPGQNAAVTFAGSSGQRVSLKVGFGSGLTADCNYLSIQKPDGTAFLSQTLTCSPSYFSDVLVLPAAGTYTIKVNPGGLGAGTSTLTLYGVPPDATASMVVGGSPGMVMTTTPGQNAAVTFAGSAAQRVALSVSFGSGLTADCNYLSIQKPDGTSLLSQTLTCSPSYFSDVLVLPAAGTYTITVNPGGLGAGSATLTLYSVPADVTRTITVGGAAAGVTTTAPGQNAVITFSGLAAQSVTVRMTGNAMGFVTVTLRKPDGSTQTSSSSSLASFNLAPQTLPVAGNYTILINPSGASIGSINVAATSP